MITREKYDSVLKFNDHSDYMKPRVYCMGCGETYCCYPHSPQPHGIDENGKGFYKSCGCRITKQKTKDITTTETLNAIATLTQTYGATRNLSPQVSDACEKKLLTLIQTIEDSYTEAQLIAFGKYLLNRKTKNKELQKSVTHADLENWKHLNQNK